MYTTTGCIYHLCSLWSFHIFGISVRYHFIRRCRICSGVIWLEICKPFTLKGKLNSNNHPTPLPTPLEKSSLLGFVLTFFRSYQVLLKRSVTDHIKVPCASSSHVWFCAPYCMAQTFCIVVLNTVKLENYIFSTILLSFETKLD